MRSPRPIGSTRKVVSVFFFVGAVSGLMTASYLPLNLYKLFDNCPYMWCYVVTWLLFLVALATSALVCGALQWLGVRFSALSSLISAAVVAPAIPGLVAVVQLSLGLGSMLEPWVPASLGVFLSHPLLVLRGLVAPGLGAAVSATLVSLSLSALTRRWDRGVFGLLAAAAILVVVICVLANVALTAFGRVPLISERREVVSLYVLLGVGEALFCALYGYGLVRAERRGAD